MYPWQPGALLVWTYMLLVPNYMEGHLVKREVRCPVYDAAVKIKNEQCPKEKAYHCFEDENDQVITDGCYKPKVCRQGSHPVQEGDVIVCALCQTGFQRQDDLKSSDYRSSYCHRHSRACDPEYGQSECAPATRESDRACTCNATLGFFSPDSNSSECECFTPNSACRDCRFFACPDGSVKNDRGFCEPQKATTAGVTVLPPEQPTPTPSGTGNNHLALAISIPLVLLLIIGGTVFLCWWRRKRQRAEQVSDGRPITQQTNGSTSNYQVQYAKNLIINGQVGMEVGNARSVTIGDHTTVYETSKNNNPHPGSTSRSNGRLCPELPADTNLGNGQLPSGTTEAGQSVQPQEPSDPSAPPDAVPAEGLSKFSPIAANFELAPPPLPTAPDLPREPSAPPPSILAEDRDPSAETGEDPDETFVKTILPAAEEATDVKTQAKVPYSSYDETDLKKPLLSDHEQTEYKTPIPMGDFGDEMLEDTDVKTLLHKDSGVTSVPPSRERYRDKVKQPVADVEGDNSIR